jgi:hypothetical protein
MARSVGTRTSALPPLLEDYQTRLLTDHCQFDILQIGLAVEAECNLIN